MHPDCERVIFSEEEIQARVAEMGKEIAKDYEGGQLILVTLLKGAAPFAVDLARAIASNGVDDVQLDFMVASSYGDTTQSSGTLAIKKDIETDITNKNVLVLDDIVDTGLTMKRICEALGERSPHTVKTAAFLLKDREQEEQVVVNYMGFMCPNEFVVGYGLDYAQRYRCLPYVGVLKPIVYARA